MLSGQFVGRAQVRRAGSPLAMPIWPNLVELRASSRAGLRFQAKRESELDEALFTLAAKLPFAGNGVAVCREFNGPRGIPDLLATTRYHRQLSTRNEVEVPAVTNHSEAAVLAALSQGAGRTPTWIANTCGLSSKVALERLRSLRSKGAALSDRGIYRRHPALEPIGNTYAFEAKVADWGKGLAQALRYLTWADGASIVLLDPPGNLTRVTDQCRSLGVGLAIEDTWRVRPRIGRPNRGLRLAASESWFQDFAPHKPSADA